MLRRSLRRKEHPASDRTHQSVGMGTHKTGSQDWPRALDTDTDTSMVCRIGAPKHEELIGVRFAQVQLTDHIYRPSQTEKKGDQLKWKKHEGRHQESQ